MRHKAAIFLLVGLAQGGCTTSVGTIPAGHSLEASAESVVVGRLEMVRPDGIPLPSPSGWLGFRMSMTTENDTSGKSYEIECDGRGFASDFYVSLPAGRYRLTRVKSGNLVTDIRASFDVRPRQVIYVGTARFTIGTAILGGAVIFSGQRGKWTVVDPSEQTMRSFRERFPQLQQTAVKSLMTME